MFADINTRTDISRLISRLSAEAVCEVGVRDGAFFKHLYAPTMYAVDVWDEYVTDSQNDIGISREELKRKYNRFKRNFPNAIIIKKLSVDAANDIPDNSLDLCYIDADHTYDAVVADLNAYLPKIRKGGVLSGHDYIDCSFRGIQFGVKTAVDEFVKKHGFMLHTTNEAKFKSFFIWIK